ncbi:hypothetical protein Purlil1_9970 [Purpureocillium lilacinum]|uniref:Uncharacterized protein n=1 Tax=Purpureocillium lilacinum TaxID=33203 RepID=A0ABR0BPL2_PURLI|nr:hypothetical protein Purlil1_9970 [Purpureocillium lilacinum]
MTREWREGEGEGDSTGFETRGGTGRETETDETDGRARTKQSSPSKSTPAPASGSSTSSTHSSTNLGTRRDEIEPAQPRPSDVPRCRRAELRGAAGAGASSWGDLELGCWPALQREGATAGEADANGET